MLKIRLACHDQEKNDRYQCSPLPYEVQIFWYGIVYDRRRGRLLAQTCILCAQMSWVICTNLRVRLLLCFSSIAFVSVHQAHVRFSRGITTYPPYILYIASLRLLKQVLSDLCITVLSRYLKWCLPILTLLMEWHTSLQRLAQNLEFPKCRSCTREMAHPSFGCSGSIIAPCWMR